MMAPIRCRTMQAALNFETSKMFENLVELWKQYTARLPRFGQTWQCIASKVQPNFRTFFDVSKFKAACMVLTAYSVAIIHPYPLLKILLIDDLNVA